jgi:hypothetical protein
LEAAAEDKQLQPGEHYSIKTAAMLDAIADGLSVGQ